VLDQIADIFLLGVHQDHIPAVREAVALQILGIVILSDRADRIQFELFEIRGLHVAAVPVPIHVQLVGEEWSYPLKIRFALLRPQHRVEQDIGLLNGNVIGH
jgi:hypothetical protein